MRILLIYPGHTYSTIDVADGYEKALQALGHEVKAYDYHNAISFYGLALSHWKKHSTPTDCSILASEHVVIDAIDFVPDIVLIVNGQALHRRAYDLLHRLNIPLALLLTESPYADGDQAVIMAKGHIAVAFTNDKASVSPLTEQTGVDTVYLPHSFDPIQHRPRPVLTQYESDVFFHGTLFPERKELIELLFDLPFDILAGGIDPDNEDVEEALDDALDNLELAYCYNSTKIALNHHRVNGRAHSLGPRAFEIAACGAFQLCDNSRPELVEVFGDSVATYANGGELLDKVGHFMQHTDEREQMAASALQRVQECTFENRAREILVPTIMEVI